MNTTQVAVTPSNAGSTDAPPPTAAPDDDPSFDDLARDVDAAAARVAELPADARSAASDLQAAIEAFHRPALVHVVRTLRDDPRGKELLFDLVDDPNVRAVLALHGIIRPDVTTRARQALDAVRPYLQSHGGDVELVHVEDGRAAVRLLGSCNGCSMSAVTLRDGVEEALVGGVDEIVGIDVLDDEPTTAFIPLSSVGRKEAADTGWVTGPAIADVPPGTMLRFDVDTGDATESFVVTNVDNSVAVFRNACVHQGMTLDGGTIDAGVITCPWHGFRFDATTGECISAPGAQLAQVPARLDGGRLRVRARAD